MNDVVVGGVVADLAAVVATAKPRKPSVSLADFSNAIIKGAAEKLTPVQVAAGLGMAIPSFNQRLVQLRKLAAEGGVTVPALADGRTGNSGRSAGGNDAVKASVIDALRLSGTVIAETPSV